MHQNDLEKFLGFTKDTIRWAPYSRIIFILRINCDMAVSLS